MSKGKYSPSLYKTRLTKDFNYNAHGKIPPSSQEEGHFKADIHMDGHDSDGYDRYGYSSLDEYGNFIGFGEGKDRLGYTEMDYLSMSDYEYEKISNGY